ncbi:hypothetical protein E2C01_054570 [Portunus trituberculatus]|uniref:Uncharacterized protein n=1 Tax=Portunus trituberculatus TaxID=210409 RepID=A0A5B7GSF5_PORTR|nr:hypothetical protein [Portunus trituberculatus]
MWKTLVKSFIKKSDSSFSNLIDSFHHLHCSKKLLSFQIHHFKDLLLTLLPVFDVVLKLRYRIFNYRSMSRDITKSSHLDY